MKVISEGQNKKFKLQRYKFMIILGATTLRPAILPTTGKIAPTTQPPMTTTSKQCSNF